MDPVTIHDLTTKFLETSQQYQVDYLIGQGAFGKVYKAHRKDNPSKFVRRPSSTPVVVVVADESLLTNACGRSPLST